jgi:hypothetical protein
MWKNLAKYLLEEVIKDIVSAELQKHGVKKPDLGE